MIFLWFSYGFPLQEPRRKASVKLHEMTTVHQNSLHALHEMVAIQNKSIVELKAFDQIVLRDLTTLATYVKKVAVSGLGTIIISSQSIGQLPN